MSNKKLDCPSDTRYCSVENCSNTLRRNNRTGICSTHYFSSEHRKQKMHENYEKKKPPAAIVRNCSVIDCVKTIGCNNLSGLCRKHRLQTTEAKKRAAAACRRSSKKPERRAKRKLYRALSHIKAAEKAYKKSPQYIKYLKKYNQSPQAAIGRQVVKANRAKAEGSFSRDEWMLLCQEYHQTCACCGNNTWHSSSCRCRGKKCKLTPDHIIPLSRGGTNYITNIQPMCWGCNHDKNARSCAQYSKPTAPGIAGVLLIDLLEGEKMNKHTKQYTNDKEQQMTSPYEGADVLKLLLDDLQMARDEYKAERQRRIQAEAELDALKDKFGVK